MLDNMRELGKIDTFYEKSIDYNNQNLNTSAGDKNHLYPKLKQSFKTAISIDIIVSFIMESGASFYFRILRKH